MLASDDKNTEMMETYACNTSGKDGAAIVLAMLPDLDGGR